MGVQDKPAAAPPSAEPFKSNYALFRNSDLAEAFAAISSIVFAYAGTPAFFNIISEMREPRHYTRAFDHLPIYDDRSLYHYRLCRLLLLRIIRSIPCARNCWQVDEESMLRTCLAGSDCQHSTLHTCKFCTLHYSSCSNFSLVWVKILLHAIPSRLQTSCKQHPYSTGRLGSAALEAPL